MALIIKHCGHCDEVREFLRYPTGLFCSRCRGVLVFVPRVDEPAPRRFDYLKDDWGRLIERRGSS